MAVKIRAAQAALNTSTGTQDITVTGFGETVKAYLCFVAGATTNGTAANNALLSMGMSDGTNQRVVSDQSQDNVTTSNADRTMDTDEVIVTIGTGSTVDGEANHDSMITNGVRINVADAFPSAYLAKFILFGGSDVTAAVGSLLHNAAIDTDVSESGLSFTPDIVFFASATTDEATVSTHFSHSFGWATNEASVVQAVGGVYQPDNKTTTTAACYVGNTRVLVAMSGGGNLNRSLEFKSFDANGFTVTKRDGASDIRTYWLALNLGGAINFKTSAELTTPTSTGDWAHTWPGWTPQAVMHLPSFVNSLNASRQTNSLGAGSLGISFMDADNEFCVQTRNDDAVTTTVEQSLADTKVVNAQIAGGGDFFIGTGPSGSGSFDASGYTINLTSTHASSRSWLGLAFEEFSGAAATSLVPPSIGAARRLTRIM